MFQIGKPIPHQTASATLKKKKPRKYRRRKKRKPRKSQNDQYSGLTEEEKW